jgi:hypothetical protein
MRRMLQALCVDIITLFWVRTAYAASAGGPWRAQPRISVLAPPPPLDPKGRAGGRATPTPADRPAKLSASNILVAPRRLACTRGAWIAPERGPRLCCDGPRRPRRVPANPLAGVPMHPRAPRSAREITDATAGIHRGARERGGVAGGGACAATCSVAGDRDSLVQQPAFSDG